MIRQKLWNSEVPEAYTSRVINELSRLCRAEADRWYRDPLTGERLFLNKGERFALIHSEITEAFEGERKDLMDDHLTHRRMVEAPMSTSRRPERPTGGCNDQA